MSFHLSNLSIPYIKSTDSDIWRKEVQFQSGEYYHIRASSGKGKSTFIHTLYGLLRKYEGNVRYSAADTRKFNHDDWCKVRSNSLGIVFQDLRLFEDDTAWQNIEIKRALTNHYPKEAIDQFAARLNITHTLNRNIDTLSYGERQRVAIIRALMQPFDTLLLDEPFSHLDNENIALASALIDEEVKKRNACLILCDLEYDKHFAYHQSLNL